MWYVRIYGRTIKLLLSTTRWNARWFLTIYCNGWQQLRYLDGKQIKIMYALKVFVVVVALAVLTPKPTCTSGVTSSMYMYLANHLTPQECQKFTVYLYADGLEPAAVRELGKHICCGCLNTNSSPTITHQLLIYKTCVIVKFTIIPCMSDTSYYTLYAIGMSFCRVYFGIFVRNRPRPVSILNLYTKKSLWIG